MSSDDGPRWRPRRGLAPLGALALALGLGGVATVATRTQTADPGVEVVAADAPPTPPGSIPILPTPTTSAEAPTTTLGSRPSAPTTTTATTDLQPADPTTTSPGPEPPSVPYDECSASDFDIVASLARTTVGVGEVVKVSATAMNVSNKTCAFINNSTVRWLRADGSEAWRGPTLHADCFLPDPDGGAGDAWNSSCTTPPGDRLDYTDCWDQVGTAIGDDLVPPGRYLAEVTFSSSFSFSLTALAAFEIVDLAPTTTTIPPGCAIPKRFPWPPPWPPGAP